MGCAGYEFMRKSANRLVSGLLAMLLVLNLSVTAFASSYTVADNVSSADSADTTESTVQINTEDAEESGADTSDSSIGSDLEYDSEEEEDEVFTVDGTDSFGDDAELISAELAEGMQEVANFQAETGEDTMYEGSEDLTELPLYEIDTYDEGVFDSSAFGDNGETAETDTVSQNKETETGTADLTDGDEETVDLTDEEERDDTTSAASKMTELLSVVIPGFTKALAAFGNLSGTPSKVAGTIEDGMTYISAECGSGIQFEFGKYENAKFYGDIGGQKTYSGSKSDYKGSVYRMIKATSFDTSTYILMPNSGYYYDTSGSTPKRVDLDVRVYVWNKTGSSACITATAGQSTGRLRLGCVYPLTDTAESKRDICHIGMRFEFYNSETGKKITNATFEDGTAYGYTTLKDIDMAKVTSGSKTNYWMEGYWISGNNIATIDGHTNCFSQALANGNAQSASFLSYYKDGYTATDKINVGVVDTFKASTGRIYAINNQSSASYSFTKSKDAVVNLGLGFKLDSNGRLYMVYDAANRFFMSMNYEVVDLWYKINTSGTAKVDGKSYSVATEAQLANVLGISSSTTLSASERKKLFNTLLPFAYELDSTKTKARTSRELAPYTELFSDYAKETLFTKVMNGCAINEDPIGKSGTLGDTDFKIIAGGGWSWKPNSVTTQSNWFKIDENTVVDITDNDWANRPYGEKGGNAKKYALKNQLPAKLSETIAVSVTYLVAEEEDPCTFDYTTPLTPDDAPAAHINDLAGGSETMYEYGTVRANVSYVCGTKYETRKAGFVLQLTGNTAYGGTYTVTSTTDSSGDVVFADVPRGSYVVTLIGTPDSPSYVPTWWYFETGDNTSTSKNEQNGSTEITSFSQKVTVEGVAAYDSSGAICTSHTTDVSDPETLYFKGEYMTTDVVLDALQVVPEANLHEYHNDGFSVHLYGTSDSGVSVDEYLVTDENGQVKFENIPVNIATADANDNYYTFEIADSTMQPLRYYYSGSVKDARQDDIILSWTDTCEANPYTIDAEIQPIEMEIQVWERSFNGSDVEITPIGGVEYTFQDAENRTSETPGTGFADGESWTRTSSEDDTEYFWQPAVGVGYATIKNVPLGYITPTSSTAMNVQDKAGVQHFDIYINVAGIDIIAIDTATELELPGVFITIYDENGEPIASNEECEYSTEKIPAGDYTVHVTQVPDRYDYPAEDLKITVKETTETQSYVLYIDHLGSITIHKFDTDGVSPLQGVTFELFGRDRDGEIDVSQTTDANGTTVFITGKDGNLQYDKLRAGNPMKGESNTYVVTETETLEGYTLLADSIVSTIPVKMSGDEVTEAGAEVDTSKGWYNQYTDTWYFFDLTYNVTNDATLDMPVTGGTNEFVWALGAVGISGFAVGAWIILGKKREDRT